MKDLTQQEKVERAYQSGFKAGKRRGEEGEKYVNGVDWRILGVTCDCGQEIIPCADEMDEDIVYWERRKEYQGQKCEVCDKFYRIVTEEGNMASKRKKQEDAKVIFDV